MLDCLHHQLQCFPVQRGAVSIADSGATGQDALYDASVEAVKDNCVHIWLFSVSLEELLSFYHYRVQGVWKVFGEVYYQEL